MLDRAERLVKNPRSESALANLAEVYRLLTLTASPTRCCSTWARCSGFDYYSGVHFEAYVSGLGAPLAGGGRYDHMLARFGYDCPSTGFAFEVGRVLLAIENQGTAAPQPGPDFFIIDFTADKTRALALSRRLRDGGAAVAAGHLEPRARRVARLRAPAARALGARDRRAGSGRRAGAGDPAGRPGSGESRARVGILADPARHLSGNEAGGGLMPNIVIVGAQWGDEGKGKVVDVITPHFDVIVRYQGGNNAGHTVVVGREKFVLQTIPSGILHAGRRNIIGCGVVVNPASLIDEMESLVQRGVSLDGNLYISKNAHVIMPYHPAIDRASESKAGKHRIGTTGKGVGPAYADKTARVGIRMADLLDERLLSREARVQRGPEEPAPPRDLRRRELHRRRHPERVPALRGMARPLHHGHGAPAPQLDGGGLVRALRGRAGDHARHRPRHLSVHHVVEHDGGRRLHGIGRAADPDQRRHRHLEGLLHPRGRRPVPHGAARRDGRSPARPRQRVRLGHGPAAALRVGGRHGPRYAARINGLDTLAITKLDVLDSCDTMKICVGYKYDDEVLTDFPEEERIWHEAEPVYEELSGWKTSTAGLRDYEDLPTKAREYLARLSELCGVGISLVSTGPVRDETILVNDSTLTRWIPSLRSSLPPH